MSKNKKKNNPYLEAYNKADKNLTQIMSDIKMLTTNPRDKMDKDTFTFKVNQLTTKWNNQLGYNNNDGKPTRDLNFIVQDLEKTKTENSTALGSRYTLIPGTNYYSALGSECLLLVVMFFIIQETNLVYSQSFLVKVVEIMSLTHIT